MELKTKLPSRCKIIRGGVFAGRHERLGWNFSPRWFSVIQEVSETISLYAESFHDNENGMDKPMKTRGKVRKIAHDSVSLFAFSCHGEEKCAIGSSVGGGG